jgi:hypothetical protein
MTHAITPPQATHPAGISPEALAERVDKLFTTDRRRYKRLWGYCRNPMRPCGAIADSGADRPYRQAQEWGLPSRITGMKYGADLAAAQAIDGVSRKEVVIENDIGWRIDTMVDFLFGKPLVVASGAPDPSRRDQITELLRLILAQSGGVLFLQQLALLGSVYGFVDVLVKYQPQADEDTSSTCNTQDLGQPPACDEPSSAETAPRDDDTRRGEPAQPRLDDSRTSAAGIPPHDGAQDLSRLARMVRLEIVEPARALPFLSPGDYRIIEAYGQCFEIPRSASDRAARSMKKSLFERLFPRRIAPGGGDGSAVVIELITPDRWHRFEDGRLVAEGGNSLGVIPLVHVQNTAVPFEYAGASDVEPLLPLQDELNTRLSDRANRITLQSFKMYLGKGIENFNSLPVAPGRMWMTDNDAADVIEFGGDASSPSEDAHLSDIREALDKTSGVTPIAAGAIKGRIGRLTSAAALRITMQALLARTEKKRTTYGAAIARMCELSLAWLDAAGVFPTTPDERIVELNWPSPLPENETEKLQDAEAKLRLGVAPEVVRRELGY